MCFLLFTNGETRGHHLMTSGTNHSSSRIGHELTLKKLGKTWSQNGTILVNSSFEHFFYHHQMPAPTTPCSDLDCGQAQGHHAGPPNQRYQAPGNNYVMPLQLPISFHASRHIFISGNSWNCFGITWKKEGMSH